MLHFIYIHSRPGSKDPFPALRVPAAAPDVVHYLPAIVLREGRTGLGRGFLLRRSSNGGSNLLVIVEELFPLLDQALRDERNLPRGGGG